MQTHFPDWRHESEASNIIDTDIKRTYVILPNVT